jgi:CRP-like cAMP-binding protein
MLSEMPSQRAPTRPSNIAVIEACTMLNSLTADERMELASQSFMAFAERGEMIWAAGSPSEFSAVVGTGFIKMSKTSVHGQEVAVELLGPGQALGILAAVEGRSYPLSAIAVTKTWYLKIPTRILLPMYQQSSGLKDSMVRGLGPRLRKAHEMMSRLSSGTVEERLAAVLFILADSYGARDENGIHLQVPLTRQDLSEMAGTTVETTIRVMSRWQKQGVLKTDSKVISILDESRLANTLS